MRNNRISLEDISIRTELQPGDVGYIIYLHGLLYSKEYNFGIQFEDYVAKGLIEFKEKYDPKRNRLWVCEYKRSSPVDKQSSPVDNDRMIGFLLLMDRGESAQLRYFLIAPAYRIDDLRSPFASAGLEGTTTFKPGQFAYQFSKA